MALPTSPPDIRCGKSTWRCGQSRDGSVARAAPDGYVLLLTTSGDAWNATLYGGLKFNFIRDFAPVAGISRAIGVLLAHPSLASKSVSQLISYARSNPGKIAVGSAGMGSLPHLYWELFRSSAGVEMLHVPYRGGALALTDLLANHIQVYFGTLAVSLEHIRLGRLRALAVTSGARTEALPEVPALAEILPGYEASSYFEIAAPVIRLSKSSLSSTGKLISVPQDGVCARSSAR